MNLAVGAYLTQTNNSCMYCGCTYMCACARPWRL